MELPNYSTKPSMAKAVIPRLVFAVVLAVLLYAGARINLSIFGKDLPGIADLVLVVFILMLAVTEIIVARERAKKEKTYFFDGRIEKRGKDPKTIILSPMLSVDVKKSSLDKIFDTGSLIFSTGQVIRDVKHPDRIQQYIMQLSRKTPRKV